MFNIINTITNTVFFKFQKNQIFQILMLKKLTVKIQDICRKIVSKNTIFCTHSLNFNTKFLNTLILT